MGKYFRFLSNIGDLIIIGAMHGRIKFRLLLRAPHKHRDHGLALVNAFLYDD